MTQFRKIGFRKLFEINTQILHGKIYIVQT